MARQRLLNEAQDAEIAKRLPKEQAVALSREFGVSRNSIYRSAKRGAGTNQTPVVEEFAEARNAPLSEWGQTGLQKFGGSIQDDYARVWRTLSDYVPLVKEMINHSSISSVLFAVEMYIRNSKLEVRVASSDPVDQEAKEFLENNIKGLSHSVDDFLSQAMSMLAFGFAPFEIVYRRDATGRIMWKKFAFRSQDSLSPGNEWEFDANGGVQAMNQKADYDRPEVRIPIEKLLLFRTTAARGNPQGKSVLRSVHESWYYSRAFAEIEGISAERLGSGLPVIYLGEGTTRAGSNSDFDFAKQLVRDIRSDEQMGVVIPFQKQGSDGRGALLELLSPPAKGAVDFNETITRYNQAITQSLLSQIVWLGVSGFGSQSLAVELQRIFEQAITAWGRSITDVLNRFGVNRLFAFNTFQLSAFPYFELVPPKNVDLMGTISALNQAVSGGLITAGPEVDRKTRETLDLGPGEEPTQNPEPTKASQTFDTVHDYEFERNPPPASTDPDRRWEESTNNLGDRLSREYRAWIAVLVERLERDRNKRGLRKLLQSSGQGVAIVDKSLEELKEKINGVLATGLMASVGLVMESADPEAVDLALQTINEQKMFFENRFLPALREKIHAFLESPEGTALELSILVGSLGNMTERLISYAGSKFSLLNRLFGMKLQREDRRVKWLLDDQAVHCPTCAKWGGKVWGSYAELVAETGGVTPGAGTECMAKCRCSLLGSGPGGFVRK